MRDRDIGFDRHREAQSTRGLEICLDVERRGLEPSLPKKSLVTLAPTGTDVTQIRFIETFK